MSDIVERLRERRALGFEVRPGFGRGKAQLVWLTNEPDRDCAKAADEIEVLRKDAAPSWQPIETAPRDTERPVVVRWVDDEGEEQRCFDYTEDGCWMEWHSHVEHVHMIGGYGVNDTPPYEHWMPLPAAPKE